MVPFGTADRSTKIHVLFRSKVAISLSRARSYWSLNLELCTSASEVGAGVSEGISEGLVMGAAAEARWILVAGLAHGDGIANKSASKVIGLQHA